ncbi:MAG: xanthine dehydrogenase family protein molybdopterin-binding subunit, partial [Acidimicrobiales bacterium]
DAGDTDEHVRDVLDDCDHVLRTRLSIGRLAGAPIECRGIVAAPDPSGKLTVWASTQAPHAVRDTIARVCGLPQHQIRVIAPDVGGGFGVKDHIYEDELMVCLAALELGRPVKWIEDRYESLIATHGARDEGYDVEVGFDADGRLRALRVDAVRANGAYLSIFGGGPLFTMGGMVPGPYTWEAVRTTGRVVATTTTPLGAYRGFGQTQACFVRERVVDLVAAELDIDPAELRQRNLVRPDQQPYALRTVPITFDNGDYPAALELARAMAASWPAAADDGLSRGVGYCTYVQMAAVGPSIGNRAIGLDVGGWERATVRMERDGTVRVIIGVTPQGQGHETTFAQLVADRLGVALASIEVIHSDTDHTPYSAYGTAASRSIAVGGGATIRAADALALRVRAIAADLLEAAPDDIVLRDGQATVAGTTVGLQLAEVADRAWQGWELPDGLDPGLIEWATYDPTAFTFSYATHVCRAAVDRETGAIAIERYAVVHDCGTVVNPTIVEGQIHGGIAQGLGGALLEAVVHDDEAQPRSTTFLDYLLPVSASMPDVEIAHLVTPSPTTPGGMKGMGEGGTNGAFACVVNAVAAAVPDVAARVTTTPVTPTVLWSLLHPDV